MQLLQRELGGGACRLELRDQSLETFDLPLLGVQHPGAESKTLDSLLSRYRAERGEKERAPRPDPEAPEALQALGYLENARE